MLAAASDDTRTLLSIVVLLAVVGLVLLMLAVWTVRATRPDRELLAPLEVMGRRKWRRSDPVWQRRNLDEVRPADAEPLSPAPATPSLDAAFEAGPQAPGFDDLPEELAEVVATSLEAEVDHDATPPSTELPIVTPDTPPPAEAPLGDVLLAMPAGEPVDLPEPAAPDAEGAAPDPERDPAVQPELDLEFPTLGNRTLTDDAG